MISFNSGKKYKILFLDTNAFSWIVKNYNNAGHFFLNRFSPNNYIPCLTIYNILEVIKTKYAISSKKTTFEQFSTFFNGYPFLLTWPMKVIIQREIRGLLKIDVKQLFFGGYTSFGHNFEDNLNTFLKTIETNTSLKQTITSEQKQQIDVIQSWTSQRPTPQKGSYVEYSKELEKMNVLKTLCDPYYEAKVDYENVNYLNYHGIRTMLYSQFMRVHHTNKEIKKSDVNDILISCIFPYVDTIITERYQASILKQARVRIKELKQVEIFNLDMLK